MKRRLKWTKEEVIEKIQAWQKQYGEIPAATDWNPGDCRKSARISTARAQRWAVRAERFSEGVYPWPRTVQVLFGSWNNAIVAAGFKPRNEAIVLDDKIDAVKTLADLEEAVADLTRARTKDSKLAHLRQIAALALSAAEAIDV